MSKPSSALESVIVISWEDTVVDSKNKQNNSVGINTCLKLKKIELKGFLIVYFIEVGGNFIIIA
jgi:hypothetical protein